MGAVGVTMEDDGTAGQTRFVSRALNVPQPNLSPARTKSRPVEGRLRQATGQLQAHHVSLSEVPAVVANCPPVVMSENLDTARTFAIPIHKSDII